MIVCLTQFVKHSQLVFSQDLLVNKVTKQSGEKPDDRFRLWRIRCEIKASEMFTKQRIPFSSASLFHGWIVRSIYYLTPSCQTHSVSTQCHCPVWTLPQVCFLFRASWKSQHHGWLSFSTVFPPFRKQGWEHCEKCSKKWDENGAGWECDIGQNVRCNKFPCSVAFIFAFCEIQIQNHKIQLKI